MDCVNYVLKSNVIGLFCTKKYQYVYFLGKKVIYRYYVNFVLKSHIMGLFVLKSNNMFLFWIKK